MTVDEVSLKTMPEGDSSRESNISMPDVPKTPRRFQFTLRRLFIVTTLAGLVLALFAQRIVEYQRSTTAAKAIIRLGGTVSWNPEILETLFEDQVFSRITDVHFTNPRLGAQQWQTLSQIPRHFGLHIDGQTFTNDSMTHLVAIEHLDYLVLDGSRVDEIGVRSFQKQRPEVTVMFGYPGDAGFRQFPIQP